MRRGICFFLRFLQTASARDNRKDSQDAFFNKLLSLVKGGRNRDSVCLNRALPQRLLLTGLRSFLRIS